jgi:protein-disulfide isomerase
MIRFLAAFGLAVVLLTVSAVSYAAETHIPERILGKANAPITVDEYVSLTCSHCAQFYNDTLPELEKKYVDSGKVRFILHDFPLDNVALKASAIARCMPEEEFYPFVKVLYKHLPNWATAPDPEKALLQYAKLGGLGEEKAKECLADSKLQDALIAGRMEATQKIGVEATPTFVINGKETLNGAQLAPAFAKIFDRLLAAKK